MERRAPQAARPLSQLQSHGRGGAEVPASPGSHPTGAPSPHSSVSAAKAPGSHQEEGTPPVRLLFCSASDCRRGKAPGEPQLVGSGPPRRLLNRRLRGGGEERVRDLGCRGRGQHAGMNGHVWKKTARSSWGSFQCGFQAEAHSLGRHPGCKHLRVRCSQHKQVGQAGVAAPAARQAAGQSVVVQSQQ